MRQCRAIGSSVSNDARGQGVHDERRLARRVEAFAPRARAAILTLIRRSSALEDLADSFPALLFALATGYGSATARRTARAAVEQGRSLREAAAALALPWWLRKLPPQALLTPFDRLPHEPALVARLISLVPAQPGVTAAWLDRVLVAYHTGMPELAVWTAQHYRAAGPAATSETFLRNLAWAWHGAQPGLRGNTLLTERWTPAVGVRRAASEAALWRERIALDLYLGPGIADSWLADGHANGYDFVALRTADDFIAEARAMDNCLDRYADRLGSGAVRIFSIRRDGEPVADVEIATHERELGMPAVTQLRAARNRRATMEVWQATYAWLGSQILKPGTTELQIKVGRAEHRRRLARFWQPFLDALPEHARIAFEKSVMPAASTPAPRVRRASPRSPRPVSPRARGSATASS